MITVRVNSRDAVYTSDDLITSGSIGIPVRFILSSDFDGLSVVAVFVGSGASIDVALTGSCACVVPHEVLAQAGGYLRIGVYGRNGDGTIAIPTVWAEAKRILQGTEPSGVDPSEPTPDWTAQVQQMATDAVDMAEAVMDMTVEAETLEPGEDASVEKSIDPVTGVVKLTFGIPGGSGGGGTSDYADLDNKPSINSVTLLGNKSLSDLGAASAADVAEKYAKPSGGIPASDMTSEVQASLAKADTALQSAPVSSVAGKTGTVALDAGDVEYDEQDTYAEGTVGADLSALKTEIGDMTVEETLLRDELPGTTTTVTLDGSGNPTSIVHSASGTTVRTDSFVWSTDSVAETRTASNKYITITTNLETLAQTISEVQEVA